MKIYNESNPPKKGNGRVIWKALKKAGFEVLDLYYKPNFWYTTFPDKRGTWACRIRKYLMIPELTMYRKFFCGILEGNVYIMTMNEPYNLLYLRDLDECLLCQM